MEDTAR